MIKYLTEEQLLSLLKLGKPVEQWLTHEKYDGYTVLKWIRIDREKDMRYSLSYVQCFDDGNEDFFDIYEFSPLNPNEPVIINTFDSAAYALEFADATYAASIIRYVSAGIIQDEYKNYLAAKRQCIQNLDT